MYLCSATGILYAQCRRKHSATGRHSSVQSSHDNISINFTAAVFVSSRFVFCFIFVSFVEIVSWWEL